MQRTSRQFFGRALLGLVLATACGVLQAADDYKLNFELRIEAGNPVGRAVISVRQTKRLLREAEFSMPAARYSNVSGDGDIAIDGNSVKWSPPATGGNLRYDVRITRERSEASFDALIERRWGLFRLDRVFPSARIRQRRGAQSQTTLELQLPAGWSAETPYLEIQEDVPRYRIENPDRLFDRPIGWTVVGNIGVRKDRIGDVEVSIGAPVGMGVERIGMLALLRWNLPANCSRNWIPAFPSDSISSRLPRRCGAADCRRATRSTFMPTAPC